VLDQHALQLERADPVLRRLEDVVGAADVGEVAVGIANGDVAGAVVAVGRRIRGLLPVVLVAQHQPRGARIDGERDLPLGRFVAVGVEQGDAVARQRPAYGIHACSRANVVSR
jgi:hypothetical protein